MKRSLTAKRRAYQAYVCFFLSVSMLSGCLFSGGTTTEGKPDVGDDAARMDAQSDSTIPDFGLEDVGQVTPDVGTPDDTGVDSDPDDMTADLADAADLADTADMDNSVPAVLIVNNDGDNGDCNATICTLRGAIDEAARGYADDGAIREINFEPSITQITALGAFTVIAPTNISGPTNGVTISFLGLTVPVFVITGESNLSNLSFVGDSSPGLRIEGMSNTLEKVSVAGFADGVTVAGTSTEIKNATIGGETIQNQVGIRLLPSSSETLIEATSVGNNTGNGIIVQALAQPAAEQFPVATINDTSVFGNQHGIAIQRGRVSVSNSKIFENALAGIYIDVPDAVNLPSELTNIVGNDIGWKVETTSPVAAGNLNGIFVQRSGPIQIGGVRSAAGCTGPCNAIAGNTNAGILGGPNRSVAGLSIGSFVVQGNFIGTTDGNDAMPNGIGAVFDYFDSAGTVRPTGLLIGAATAQNQLLATCEGACNLFGPANAGGAVASALALNDTGGVVRGNFFGVSDDGTTAFPTDFHAVDLSRQSNLVFEENYVASSNRGGVLIRRPTPDSAATNLVRYNRIGGTLANTCANNLSISQAGISVSTTQTIDAGTWRIVRNSIGCVADAIFIQSAGTSFVVDSNLIGGEKPVQNRGVAVRASQVDISANYISNTTGAAVDLFGPDPPTNNNPVNIETRNVRVFGNVFGRNLAGTMFLRAIEAIRVRLRASNVAIYDNSFDGYDEGIRGFDLVTFQHTNNTFSGVVVDPISLATTSQNDLDDIDIGPNTGINAPTVDAFQVNGFDGTVPVKGATVEPYEQSGGNIVPSLNVGCANTLPSNYTCGAFGNLPNPMWVTTTVKVTEIPLTDAIDGKYQISVGTDMLSVDDPTLPNLLMVAEAIRTAGQANGILINHRCKEVDTMCPIWVVSASAATVIPVSVGLGVPENLGFATSELFRLN